MPETSHQKTPGLPTNRLEAFSDGVFAIAITLLILTIAVPVLSPTEVAEGKLSPALIALLPKFLSFVVSFLVIGIFWVGHHMMFHYIVRTDRVLLWLNLLLLLAISFFPFPVALIGEYGSARPAVLLYGATLFFGGCIFSLIWFYATRQHHLVPENLPQDMIRLGQKVILFAPFFYGIATLLAFVAPAFSIALYIFVPLGYLLPSPVDRLMHFAEMGKTK